MSKHARTTLDHARDELYRQIHRCGVLDAADEHRQEWIRDTMQYLEDVYPELSDRELHELRDLGERFCQPPIPHGRGYTDLNREAWEADAPSEAETAAAS